MNVQLNVNSQKFLFSASITAKLEPEILIYIIALGEMTGCHVNSTAFPALHHLCEWAHFEGEEHFVLPLDPLLLCISCLSFVAKVRHETRVKLLFFQFIRRLFRLLSQLPARNSTTVFGCEDFLPF
jgi:hypothetical protein